VTRKLSDSSDVVASSRGKAEEGFDSKVDVGTEDFPPNFPRDFAIRPLSPEQFTFRKLAYLEKIPGLAKIGNDIRNLLRLFNSELQRLEEFGANTASELSLFQIRSLELHFRDMLGIKEDDLNLRIIPGDCSSQFGKGFSTKTPLAQVTKSEILLSESLLVQTPLENQRPEARSTLIRHFLGRTKFGERFSEALVLSKIAAGFYLKENPNAVDLRFLRRLVSKLLRIKKKEDVEVCVLNIVASIHLGEFLRKTRGLLPLRPELLAEVYQDNQNIEENRELGSKFMMAAYQLAARCMSAKSPLGQEEFFPYTESAYAALSFLQQGTACVVALLFADIDSDEMEKILTFDKLKNDIPPTLGLRTLIANSCNLHRAARELASLPEFPAIPSTDQVRPNYNVQLMINYRLEAIRQLAVKFRCRPDELLALDLARNIAEVRSLYNRNDDEKKTRAMAIGAFYGTMAEHLGAHDFHRYLSDMLKKCADVHAYRRVSKNVVKARGDRSVAENLLKKKCEEIKTFLEASFVVKLISGESRHLNVSIVPNMALAHRMARLPREQRPKDGPEDYSESDLFVVGDLKTISSIIEKEEELKKEWRSKFMPHCQTSEWLQERVHTHIDLNEFKKSLVAKLMRKSSSGGFEDVRLQPWKVELIKCEISNYSKNEMRFLIDTLLKTNFQPDASRTGELFAALSDGDFREMVKDAVVDSLNLPGLARDLLRFGIVVSGDLGVSLPELSSASISLLGFESALWSKDNHENQSRQIHEKGNVACVLQKFPQEIDDSRTIVGEVQVHDVDYPYFGGRPVRFSESHSYRRLTTIFPGQGNNYLDQEFAQSGDWTKDVAAAQQSVQHSDYFCLRLHDSDLSKLPRMSCLRSIGMDNVINVPVVVTRLPSPSGGTRFLDVLAAYSLAYGIPLARLAVLPWRKCSSIKDERVTRIELDERVSSGDAFEIGASRGDTLLQDIDFADRIGGASMARRVYQLRADDESVHSKSGRKGRVRRKRSERSRRKRPTQPIRDGKDAVFKIFGVPDLLNADGDALNEDRIVDYITEINREWVLLDYGVSRFLLNQDGLKTLREKTVEQAFPRHPGESKDVNIDKLKGLHDVLDQRLESIYMLASDPKSREIILDDIREYKNARFIKLSARLAENGTRIILKTDQDKSGMLVAILDNIAKCRELPNILQIEPRCEVGPNSVSLHTFDFLCVPSLSEGERDDLCFVRQLLIDRGGESPSAISRSLKIKTRLEDMGPALLHFAKCLGKGGMNIDSYRTHVVDDSKFEVEFVITPPAALAMDSLSDIESFLRNTIGQQVRDEIKMKGTTYLPSELVIEEIPLEIANQKVGSAGIIVRAEEESEIESD